jgi:hypothetical protein
MSQVVESLKCQYYAQVVKRLKSQHYAQVDKTGLIMHKWLKD